jgi:putative MATE family efflux protein
MDRSMNMTTGNPARLIFRLAVPFMLTNIGQQLYGIIDAIIVGRGVGVSAFAALGACDWLIWAILWAVTGITQGFSTLLAKKFGANDKNGLRHALSMCTWLSLIFGSAVTIVFVILARPLLAALGTPASILTDAVSYLTMIYGGTLIITGYNMSAAALRAVGDGRTPLVAMILAGSLNVILDLVFVMGLRLGIRGAAAATLLAQLFAFLYCLVTILRSPLFQFHRADWQFDMPMAAELWKLGLPLALESTIVVIGGIFAQSVINSYGESFVAGCTAANKLHGTLDCSAVAIGYASSTYIGQNWGANRLDRVHTGIRKATMISVAIGLLISAAMLLLKKPVVNLFLDPSTKNASDALQVAYGYITVMSIMLVGAYIMNLYRYSLQGLGNTLAPMLSGFFELGARVGVALLLPIWLGRSGLFYMDGAAWWAAGIFQFICFWPTLKKRDREAGKSRKGKA